MGKQSQLAFARIYRMKVLFRGDGTTPPNPPTQSNDDADHRGRRRRGPRPYRAGRDPVVRGVEESPASHAEVLRTLIFGLFIKISCIA